MTDTHNTGANAEANLSAATGLAALLDRQAIVDTAVAYCWALDGRRWDVLREHVFAPDATATLGEECADVDAIVARIRRALDPLDVSQHSVSTHQVELDGDRAAHRAYLHAQHVRHQAEGGPNFIVAGTYTDRFVRTADGWRIAHRTLSVLWTEGNSRVVRPTGDTWSLDTR